MSDDDATERNRRLSDDNERELYLRIGINRYFNGVLVLTTPAPCGHKAFVVREILECSDPGCLSLFARRSTDAHVPHPQSPHKPEAKQGDPDEGKGHQ